MPPYKKGFKAQCNLMPKGEFDDECFSSGIMCEECDFLEYVKQCDGICDECQEQREGNCVPA